MYMLLSKCVDKSKHLFLQNVHVFRKSKFTISLTHFECNELNKNLIQGHTFYQKKRLVGFCL